MKVTLLNGSPAGDGFTDGVATALSDAAQAQGGAITAWSLRDETIAACVGCFDCWIKTPGVCRMKDVNRDITRSVIQSDLTIWVTPVTFGGYSSELKKAMDHLIPLIMPFFTRIDGEVHHQPRYARYPDILGVGVLPASHPAQEQIFQTLVSRNAINLHSADHSSVVVYRHQTPAAAVDALHNMLPHARRISA